jgi:hypothetical protein
VFWNLCDLLIAGLMHLDHFESLFKKTPEFGGNF